MSFPINFPSAPINPVLTTSSKSIFPDFSSAPNTNSLTQPPLDPKDSPFSVNNASLALENAANNSQPGSQLLSFLKEVLEGFIRTADPNSEVMDEYAKPIYNLISKLSSNAEGLKAASRSLQPQDDMPPTNQTS